MKTIFRLLFILVVFGAVFFASHRLAYAKVGFEKLDQTVNGGYINKTCECYADALDNGRYGESAGKLEGDCSAGENSTVNSESWIQDAFQNNAFALANSLVGACETNSPDIDVQVGYFNNSLVGMTTKGITSIYTNPPASSTYYVADLIERSGFAEPVYAQAGIGYSGLRPLIDLWRMFRNMAYIILVIILVVVGFMIMFRMNINPQTVISVQNALPGIVVTLILITFSYAIAGLLIDLMYFVTFFIISIFGQAMGSTSDIAEFQQVFINSNSWTLFNRVLNWRSIVALPLDLWGVLIPSGFTAGAGLVAATFIGSVPLGIISIVVGALPVLIIAFALFLAFIRIFMILLISYIMIIFNIIFAPFILLRGAVPGSNAFTGWIRTLVGNLSVYPSTAGIILLTKLITSSIFGLGKSDPMWSPPFLFGPSANTDAIVALISLGILLLAPSIILKIKNSIAEPPAMPISPGVIVGPAAGMVGRGVGMYGTYHQIGGENLRKSAMKALRPGKGDTEASSSGN